MDNIVNGSPPKTWPYDKTAVDYQNWLKGFPTDNELNTNVILYVDEKEPESNGKWKNVHGDNPSYKRTCFCQRQSVPGNPIPPPYPEIPMNEFCEQNWSYMPSTKTCVFYQISPKSWQASEDFCKGKGGNLVSANSPETLDDIQKIANLIPDPSSIGKDYGL